MREILFKAKRLDNGEWVEGFFCKRKHYCFDNRTDDLKTVIMTEFSSGGFVCYEVDESTICQYTGMTDKNGKKIFEGDILKCFDGKICVVEWDKENARFLGFTIGKERYICYVGREPKSEVIGNIHDNPELLKGGGGDEE